MTLEEVSNYLMDIENDSVRMQKDLERILQLFHPGVSFNDMGSLGRKIKKSNIRYLTVDPILLYPIGAPKTAYRCWYNSNFGLKSPLIEDKKKFPKLSSWHVTPASRIFIWFYKKKTPSFR